MVRNTEEKGKESACQASTARKLALQDGVILLFCVCTHTVEPIWHLQNRPCSVFGFQVKKLETFAVFFHFARKRPRAVQEIPGEPRARVTILPQFVSASHKFDPPPSFINKL